MSRLAASGGGGRFRLEEPEPEEPGLLMTSMIDVIFILLAFFVCVSELKKGKLDVDVPEVPSAATPEAPTGGEPILVEVSGDDRVFVSGVEARGDDALADVLRREVARVGVDAPVRLSGDKQARNGTMMRVVSQLSRAGLKRIEFEVEAGH